MMSRPEPGDAPDFVVVGHVAVDVQPDGSYRLGGTVTYAALLAARLGLRVGIVTSGTEREGEALALAIPGARIVRMDAPTATIFENIYEGDRRTQYLRGRARALRAEDVPEAWRVAPIALLGPIAAEVDPSVAVRLDVGRPGAIRATTPQGWLRAWDATGRVSPTAWARAGAILPHLSALVCSVEDGVLASWAARLRYLVVTDGPRGARLWVGGGSPIDVPAYRVPDVDPTGAGDVFAAAFLIALWRGEPALEAVRFAHAAAAFVVATPGASGMPTEEQIRGRMGDG
jgi:1D-myo-inositol 3-kinase